MSRLDWTKPEQNRRMRRASSTPKPFRPGGSLPPSQKQMALLKRLALETGRTFVTPRTTGEASQQIKLLLEFKGVRKTPKKKR